jgi:signal transduction histidine kinase/DNA-binding response OmpR family regulator
MILARPTPPSRITLIHENVEAGEAIARMLRSAGHRVTLLGRGRKLLPGAIESAPEILIVSLGLESVAAGTLIRSVRQALGEVPVLVVVGRERPDALVEADEVIREPVDPGELDLRVGGLLRAQADRRGLERKVQELLGLYKLSWTFSLSSGVEVLYGQLARVSAEILRAEKGVILLYDSERRQMVAQSPAFGISAEQVARVRYPVDGEARSRWNFRKNGPLLSNKAHADSRFLPEAIANLGIRQSVIVAPLSHGAEMQGLLLLGDRAQGPGFTDEDLNLLLSLAAQASVALENIRLHETLKHTNTLLQEYDRVKSEFVAIVAHDFRRPLMAIRGFAELILEEPDIPADARQEFMRTVISETEDLARLADDTLLITRIETGEFAHRWSEVDLGPFVLDSMPLGLSDHSILMDIPAEFPKILADPDRLRQVLTNLIMNAIKYSDAGSSIIVRCRERGAHHITIEVIDHGLGIPEDQIPRLFQKFQRVRTDEHLRIPGTGLGLYICRLIVEGHGGQIWIESELGKGSTFGVVLPRDARAAGPRAPIEPVRRLTEPTER